MAKRSHPRWTSSGVVLAFAALAVAACGGSADGGSGAAGAAGSAGSGGGGTGGGGGSGCDRDGKHYALGQSYSPDGCNTCTCGESGDFSCTLMACLDSGMAPVCTFGGQSYPASAEFPAGDGCNTCTCMPDGQVGCTTMACAPGCVQAGQTYPVGATFPALDQCAQCTCLPDLTITCQDSAESCPCDPATEWWRDYVATSPSACATIKYGCPENTKGFQNTCGCGCEQDASCPEYFDCMPPSPCDAAQIKKDCPYSDIAL